MSMIVHHAAFGSGSVVEIQDSIIVICFGNIEKKFKFPQAFDNFLSTTDADLQKRIAEAKAKEKAEQQKAVEREQLMAQQQPTQVRHESAPVRRSYTGAPIEYSSNSLVGERAQSLPIYSEEEMFEIVGYMAYPGRVNSIEAEVPKDGRDKVFESMFPGQTYRPIELGYTPSGMPNKLSPQFRINFGSLSNCPTVLKSNMGKGNGSCVGRINKSKFVILIVQKYGFRFGDWQDRAAIRKIAVDKGYADAFDRGYSR